MVAWRWFNFHPIGSADPLLNNRNARLVGDSVWTAYGADAGIGTKLRITGTGERGGVIVEAV